jgi:hypothetical protein
MGIPIEFPEERRFDMILRYQAAACAADAALLDRFGTNTFENNSPEHSYWLSVFDEVYGRLYRRERRWR